MEHTVGESEPAPPREVAGLLAHRPAVADYPPGATLHSRVIVDLEIVWLLSATAVFSCEGVPEAWALTPGEVLVVPPGRRHSFAWAQDRPTRHGYVHAAADPAFLRYLRSRGPIRRRATSDDPLAGLCAYLAWLGRRAEEDWQQPVTATLQLLLRLLLDSPLPRPHSSRELPAPMRSALEHLHRLWQSTPLRSPGVRELARAAAVSPTHLNRQFRGCAGHSVAATVEQLRISRVESLLLATDLPLDAVARHCGFADAVHLSKRFAAIHGVPPGQYRRSGMRASVLDDPALRGVAAVVWP